MKKRTFLLMMVSVLSSIFLFDIAHAQQKIKPLQPSPEIRISVSSALQKQLESIGNLLLNEKDFIQAADKIDRSIALRGLEAGRIIQRTKVPTKPQIDSFRQAMIQFYSQVDNSGLTYQILRLAPEIAANFQFSNPEYIQLEKQIMQRQNLTVTKDYESEILTMASNVDRNKQQFLSKRADPMMQLAVKIAGPGGGGGGPLLSGICNYVEFIDAVSSGDRTRAAAAALSLVLIAIGLLM